MTNRKLGKYEVLERLGRGGMAEVYRAYHANLDRYVAIKVLHTFLADDPDFKSRFEREAQNIAKLRHPNIVQVYDFDYEDEGGSYYMVMELITGITLKDRINELERGQFLPMAEALRIVREAASALAYAHSRNMIHRDVKPANLMIDSHDNRVVLTDFGIAKIVTGAQFTVSGGMVGTPAYMAPEQGLGEAGDERSDLYSLGAIFYHLTTGKLPYDAETPLAVILKHLHEPTPSARLINPAVTESIDLVINKLMAKRPVDRYQNASELIADLERVERGETLSFTESVRTSAELGSGSVFDTYIFPPTDRPHKTVETRAVRPQRSLNGWLAGSMLAILLVVIGFIVVGAANGMFAGIGFFPSLTPTASPTNTATNTPTITATASSTNTFTPTATNTDEPTATNTDEPTATETTSSSVIVTTAPIPSRTPTNTASPSRTPSPTASNTPTNTPTSTRTPSPTRTPTRTPSPTRTPTSTPLPITLTVAAATQQAINSAATLAACTYNYEIIDQDPADGEFFTIETPYLREITLRNVGNCAWAPLTSLVFISGENFSVGPFIRLDEEVAPQEVFVLQFEGRTPSQTGLLTGIWQLRTPALRAIGDPIEISVDVYDPGPGG